MSFNRPCLECGKLTRGASRCAKHQAARDAIYGGDWQARSRAQRAAVPYCQLCGAKVDLTADHVEPRSLARGLMTLCRSCNSRRGDGSH